LSVKDYFGTLSRLFDELFGGGDAWELPWRDLILELVCKATTNALVFPRKASACVLDHSLSMKFSSTVVMQAM
jgi:hypothetical protein